MVLKGRVILGGEGEELLHPTKFEIMKLVRKVAQAVHIQ